MTNSRATSATKLDHHLATGTETTYTFTPSLALDMKTTYREITIIMTGKATAALEIRLKVNGQTDYDTTFNINDTSTDSTALAVAATTIVLIPIGILDGANLFNIRAEIVFNDASDFLMVQCRSSAPHEGNFQTHGTPQTSASTITSIELQVSTSTWIAGTEISIYGLKR